MKNKFKSGNFQLLIILLFIIICVALSKFLENNAIQNQNYISTQRDIYAPTMDIYNQDFRMSFTVTGNVEAMHQISIVPQANGRIVWVNDKLFKGEKFNANEPLFEIDRTDYDIQIVKSEAELARASTAFDIEKAEADSALEEWKSLNGNIPAPDLALRKPQLKEAQAKLKAALAEHEQAQLHLSRTIFKLPFNGQIINSNISEGQFVTAGQIYGTAYNSNLLEVNSSLSDKQLQILSSSVNPKITIKIINLATEKTYKSHLKKSATYIDKTTRYADVRFAIDEPDHHILIGSFAKVIIQGTSIPNIALIPTSAIQKDGTILLVDKNNILSKITPQIIQTQSNLIAVSGLDENYRVVTQNMPSAIAGMKIITDKAN